MATIFYQTNEGTAAARPIYGVHPTGDVAVPAGVASFVADAPAGCERTHVVDTTRAPTLALDPSRDAKLDAEADAALNLKAIKALGLALGTHPALGLTPAQIRTRFLAAWRTL